MKRPVFVQALPGYVLHLRYDDGVEGDVDVSAFVGTAPFRPWNDLAFFQCVHIGPHREIRWNDDIELCPDSLYMQITGMTPENYFAEMALEPLHA